MKKADLDLHTDYQLSAFRAATATGLSEVVDEKFNYDQMTGFLSEKDFTLTEMWRAGQARGSLD